MRVLSLAVFVATTAALNTGSIQDRLAEVSQQVAKLKHRTAEAAVPAVVPVARVADDSAVVAAEKPQPPAPLQKTVEISSTLWDAEETKQLLQAVQEKLSKLDTSSSGSGSSGSGGGSMVSEISAMRGSQDSQKVELNLLKANLGSLRSSTDKELADLRTEIGNVREGVAEQMNLRLAGLETDVAQLKTATAGGSGDAGEQEKPKYSSEELYEKIVNLEKSIETVSAVQTTMNSEQAAESNQDFLTKLTSTTEGQFTLAVAGLAVVAILLAVRNAKAAVPAPQPAAEEATKGAAQNEAGAEAEAATPEEEPAVPQPLGQEEEVV